MGTPQQDGAGLSAAPPGSVGGLGNFKGVMLCNRPPDDSRRLATHGDGPVPFKSTIAPGMGEQVGLQPCKKLVPEGSGVKTRGSSAALRRHCQWIRELQDQVHEDQRRAEDGAANEEERKQRMQEVFKKQRDAIRQMKQERDKDSIEPHEVEAVLKGNKKKKKPLWAMTESEKDCCEEDEAEDLIRFAEDLDFDKYINDLEFRECLSVIKDRAKKLQKEQEAFKDSILKDLNSEVGGEDDARSTSTSSPRGAKEGGAASRRRGAAARRPDDRPDWDASTACGDEEQPAASRGARAVADRALEANPQLRAVHSKSSVQRLAEKAREAAAE